METSIVHVSKLLNNSEDDNFDHCELSFIPAVLKYCGAKESRLVSTSILVEQVLQKLEGK
jgi:hypothetical protein